jgi:hypothetical protein
MRDSAVFGSNLIDSPDIKTMILKFNYHIMFVTFIS